MRIQPLTIGLIVAAFCLPAMASEDDALPGAAADTEVALTGALDETTASPWGYEAPPLPVGRLITGTMTVVALICLGVWALKKLNGGAPLNKGRYMEVLEVRPVTRGVHVLMVKVGPKVLVVASGPGGIASVGELDEVDLPPPPEAGGPSAFPGFGALFRRVSGETP